MLWEEDESKQPTSIPDDIVDLSFALECRELPVDHAHALSTAILAVLPWLADDERIGIHQVHVAASQNGWERPQSDSGQTLCLSRRTRLTLRLPRDQLDAARELTGSTLDIDGYLMQIGAGRIRPLSRLGTLFSRYIVTPEDEDEEGFLQRMAAELATMEIRVKKALCGLPHSLVMPQGRLGTRSLMLADLSIEESIQLQREGLGSHRKLGCGIFIPHKGIEPVGKPGDDANA